MKGQLSGIDFLFALIIFSLVFAAYSVWIVQFQPVDGLDQSALLLFNIRHMLFESPGIPSNWNASNVKIPGLVDQRTVINSVKLSRFLAMNYSQITSVLGVGSHEFYFELSHLNGTIIASTGVDGTGNATSAQLKSLVMNNGTIAVSTLRLSK